MKQKGFFTVSGPPMVVRVVPGAASKLYLVAPSIVAKGEQFSIRGRVEDINSNIGAHLKAPITLQLMDSTNNIVNTSQRDIQATSCGTFISKDWHIDTPGIYRVRARAGNLPQALVFERKTYNFKINRHTFCDRGNIMFKFF